MRTHTTYPISEPTTALTYGAPVLSFIDAKASGRSLEAPIDWSRRLYGNMNPNAVANKMGRMTIFAESIELSNIVAKPYDKGEGSELRTKLPGGEAQHKQAIRIEVTNSVNMQPMDALGISTCAPLEMSSTANGRLSIPT